MDLAALEQAARLLDPEAGRDAAAIYGELGRLTRLREAPTAECAVWVSERPLALDPLALPVARARGSDDENAGPFTSLGVREPQFTEVAYSATQTAGGHRNFFYLNWP